MTFRPYNTIKTPTIEYSRTNTTGVTINKSTPTRINSSGDVDFVDISNETQVKAIFGLAGETIPNTESGNFVQNGLVEDVSLGFNFEDPVYISKSGGLTNVEPEIGVGGFVVGDFVVKVGVVSKNVSNPSLRDIIVDIDVVGQLN